jgi:hypothetical protein
MKCESVVPQISAYVDGELTASERPQVELHLDLCSRCSDRVRQHRGVRASLRSLPRPAFPENLAVSLQVSASRESVRRSRYGDFRATLRHWRESLALRSDNLMRPLALPFAGGLVSTVFLFSIFIPTLQQPSREHGEDVPTALATDAVMLSLPAFDLRDNDIVVDVAVDENGQMIDYSLPAGTPQANDPAERRKLENTLLFSRFLPATNFGRPYAARTRISLQKGSQLDVTPDTDGTLRGL